MPIPVLATCIANRDTNNTLLPQRGRKIVVDGRGRDGAADGLKDEGVGADDVP